MTAVHKMKCDITPFSRTGPRPLDPGLALCTCQYLRKTPQVQLHRQLLVGVCHLKALDAFLSLRCDPVLELDAATHLCFRCLIPLAQTLVTVDLYPKHLVVDAFEGLGHDGVVLLWG